jgi:carboxylesterase
VHNLCPEKLLHRELREARSAGVREDDCPFFLAPATAKAAVLLVHGFSATPWEMRPLADSLVGRGFACLAVRLPGHGTSPEDLATRRWEEWLEPVLAGHDRLTAYFPRIYGAGLSTGALLALLLARQRPLGGVVLLSPYLRLQHRLAPFAGWLRHLKPYQRRTLSDEASLHYYTRRPLAGIHQINRLLHHLSDQLETITTPVLAIHGEGDQVVDIDSGRTLVGRLGSSCKVYRRFGPDAPHVLTAPKSPCRDEVLALVGEFLTGLESQLGRVASNC